MILPSRRTASSFRPPPRPLPVDRGHSTTATATLAFQDVAGTVGAIRTPPTPPLQGPLINTAHSLEVARRLGQLWRCVPRRADGDICYAELRRGRLLHQHYLCRFAVLNGDGFSKKFGGPSGNDPDFFKLTITGKDATGATTGAVDLFLADYRFSDNSLDYVLSDWTFVDLSSLGAVSSLAFALDSSDTGQFGINTPGYFALDDLSVNAVPEPSTALMLVAGGLILLITDAAS